MVKVIGRFLLINIIVMAMLIALAIFWGYQLNRLPGLRLQAIDPQDSTLEAFDIYTGVRYPYELTSLYQSPDGNQYFDTDWRNFQMYIYVYRDYQVNPTLLGAYDVESARVSLTWSNDSASIFMVDKAEYNEIVLYEIDVTTGEISVFGIYPFQQIPMYIYMIDEQHLMLWRPGEFILLNVITGDYYSEASTIFPMQSRDDRYLTYGINPNLQPHSQHLIYYLLDIETHERRQLGTETISPGILYAWSPVEPILAFTTPDGDYLYYAESDIYEPLPETYQFIITSNPWSPDGRFLFVSRRLDDDRKEYAYLERETGNITTIFTADRRDNPHIYGVDYYLMWSPKQDLILSVPDRSDQHLIFTVYDADTLETIHYTERSLTRFVSRIYVSWMPEFR